MNLTLMTDSEILKQIALRARDARIELDLRQSDLSERSAVPLSAVRVFERSGTISFVYLVKILRVLSRLDELACLFKSTEMTDLRAVLKEQKPSRKRVRK